MTELKMKKSPQPNSSVWDVFAEQSGLEATSGKLILKNEGVKVEELSAVVFTRSEINRLFEGLSNIPSGNEEFHAVGKKRIGKTSFWSAFISLFF